MFKCLCHKHFPSCVGPGPPRSMCKDRIKCMRILSRDIEIILRAISCEQKWGGSQGRLPGPSTVSDQVRSQGKEHPRAPCSLRKGWQGWQEILEAKSAIRGVPHLPRRGALSHCLGAAHGKRGLGTKVTIVF